MGYKLYQKLYAYSFYLSNIVLYIFLKKSPVYHNGIHTKMYHDLIYVARAKNTTRNWYVEPFLKFLEGTSQFANVFKMCSRLYYPKNATCE